MHDIEVSQVEATRIDHGVQPDVVVLDKELLLQEDERWQLVQRILRSSGFQRAIHLRQILIYVARCAILHPDEPIREHQIACEALGRRADFDPATDNIVRVQCTHLRRRLDAYFTSEGRHEPVTLAIPKGGYSPVFRPAIAPINANEPVVPMYTGTTAEQTGDEKTSRWGPFGGAWTSREVVLVGILCLSLAVAIASLVWVRLHRTSVTASVNPSTNLILRPLLQNGAPISVVLPDTTLLVLQEVRSLDISVSGYVSNFPKGTLEKIDDPALRQAMTILGTKRSTPFSEATIGSDLRQALSESQSPVRMRFAPDLHVRDFSEANSVIVGSRRSNPWAGLFTDRTNFRYVPNERTQVFYFLNVQPAPGEATQYTPQYTPDSAIGYVDIVLTPNLTNTGYVLLINGSDAAVNESAVRFILHGSLPHPIKARLEAKNIRSFELFLRGKHYQHESDDTFEIVAFRSSPSS